MSAAPSPIIAAPLLLVVEDDEAMRFQLIGVFENAEFRVLGAPNASEALALLRARDDIDALLTDVDMPGVMDGLALAKLARNCWPYLTITVMSGRPLPLGYPLPERVTFQSKPFIAFAMLTHLRVQLSLSASLRAASARQGSDQTPRRPKANRSATCR